MRTVAAGDSVVAPRATRRLITEYVAARPLLRADPRLDTLTECERRTLIAVARGLSNAEIPDEQHLSEATVKTHVSRMLAKLGLRSRVQAVVLAYETGQTRIGSTSGPSSRLPLPQPRADAQDPGVPKPQSPVPLPDQLLDAFDGRVELWRLVGSVRAPTLPG